MSSSFSKLWSRKNNRRIYYFVKEYYHKDCTPQFINFNKNILFTYFPHRFAYIVRSLWNLCVQIFEMLDSISLPLILSSKKMITTKTIISKKAQVAHVDKGNDNIIITQSTHSTSTCPMTCSKVKSTTVPSTKLASEHTHLLKTTGMHDSYQPVITLASLGSKRRSSHGKEKNH